MDVERLRQILQVTTMQLRKGEEVEGDPALVEAVKSFKEGDDRRGRDDLHIHVREVAIKTGHGGIRRQ